MNRIFYFALVVVLLFGCTGLANGQSFETIKIGSQVWMAKNFNLMDCLKEIETEIKE